MITQDKNHIPWNTNHIPARVIVLWQENVRGTRNASLADDRYNLLWMWFLNVWDNVPMDLKYAYQQYFTCMCFLGFIKYNKTFIACGFRKYENLFTHEYRIPLARCLRECNACNKCIISAFSTQHIKRLYFDWIQSAYYFWTKCLILVTGDYT